MSLRRLALPACLAAAALVLTACGGPDADPRDALEAVCGEDAAITETDSDAATDDAYEGTPLQCRADGHLLVAEQYVRDAAEIAHDHADEYASGNGDHLVYAVAETDGGAGTVVYPYGTEEGDDGTTSADVAVLDPLDDDGWDVVEPR